MLTGLAVLHERPDAGWRVRIEDRMQADEHGHDPEVVQVVHPCPEGLGRGRVITERARVAVRRGRIQSVADQERQQEPVLAVIDVEGPGLGALLART